MQNMGYNETDTKAKLIKFKMYNEGCDVARITREYTT